MVLTKWEGTECFQLLLSSMPTSAPMSPWTGKGTIDGNGAVTFQWLARPARSWALDRLRQMGIDSIPVYERVFGEGYYLRPCMIANSTAARMYL
ncbi:MAG: hypothetical protein ACLUE2_01550 [Bacteroides cellulosilyticus]